VTHHSSNSSAVREVVIVIPDLYLAAAAQRQDSGRALPGLEHIGRFGTRATLLAGWRSWLADWLLDAADPFASLPPAVAVEYGLRPALSLTCASDPGAAARSVWFATPLHLIAGLTRVHLDAHGLLRLRAQEAAAFGSEFARVFAGSSWELAPLESGEFLAFGPPLAPALTTEPARWLGGDVGEVLPSGPGSTALRQLGAEIEMWLHGSVLNEKRTSAAEPAVSTLWLWGGGTISQERPRAANRRALLLGSDSYLLGLAQYIGTKPQALPARLVEVLGYPEASRAALVAELAGMLQPMRDRTSLEALATLDESFLQPGIEAVKTGELEQLTVLANDRRLTVRRGHGLRRWRRARPGLRSFT
jgi:hypothetical protein